jgi:hypothetical protein
MVVISGINLARGSVKVKKKPPVQLAAFSDRVLAYLP